MALLAALEIAAISRAEMPASLGVLPATRAMATVDFYEGDALEARIDIVSAILGEQGNGLQISFAEASLAGLGTNVLGNAETGYSVLLDDEIGIPYPDIAHAIQLIPEVLFARFILLEAADSYDASLQDIPPLVVLSGGTEAVVPEPGTLVLATVLSVVFGACRRRCSASPTA